MKTKKVSEDMDIGYVLDKLDEESLVFVYKALGEEFLRLASCFEKDSFNLLLVYLLMSLAGIHAIVDIKTDDSEFKKYCDIYKYVIKKMNELVEERR